MQYRGITSAAKASFPVHKNFLCHYSFFFDAAISGSLEEGQKQECSLNIEGPIFATVLDWIYTQRVGEMALEPLVKLWVMAEKLIIPKLQKECARPSTVPERAFSRWVNTSYI